ncbi:MAG: excinuclease ABC subunit UvrC [Deltaproteobacteria bacterium]|nr:MAG: excinuclease ABC subunit UvrC [Deltaproteobacteria bacterium]
MSSFFQFEPDRFPTRPGVYLMKGADGEVLYVGKANNLRARLRSYFGTSGDGRAHVRFLLEKVHSIDTIVTDTGKEALILENTLIKRHRPRYNINLRDDKTYVCLRLDLNEEFPTLQITRRVRNDGARYFGPFASAGAVRQTLKEIYRIFPLRHYPIARCQRRGRPCLFHQIGQCSGPCHGLISAQEYRNLVNGAIALLEGRQSEAIDRLRQLMHQASENMQFEEAARLRDQILAIEATVEQQKVVGHRDLDQDVFGIWRDRGQVELAVLFFRRGKLVDRRDFNLEWRLDTEELLASFLQEFYARDLAIPDQILLPIPPHDADSLREWLRDKRGRKVEVLVPVRGAKAALVTMANHNAEEQARKRQESRDSAEALLGQIRTSLHLARLPRRIECFDISTFQGGETVGSMVVALDGTPAKEEYRRYRVRSVTGTDDFGSLREVLLRRLTRGQREGSLPDMLLIDGGKGQVAAVADILRGLGLEGNVDLVGIAKSRVHANARGKIVERSEERFFLPGRKNPVVLRAGSPVLFQLQHLRDEAHRFAIEYHRRLRNRRTLASTLDTIPGIGPGRRKALLKHFGSLKKIRAASLEQLCQVPGLPKAVALSIYQALREDASPSDGTPTSSRRSN